MKIGESRELNELERNILSGALALQQQFQERADDAKSAAGKMLMLVAGGPAKIEVAGDTWLVTRIEEEGAGPEEDPEPDIGARQEG